MVTAHVQRTPPGGWPRPAALERLAAGGLGSVPPPALALAGIVSVQLGAALAKQLFAVTGPLGAVAMRVGFAAVILLVAWRPSFRVGRRAVPVIIGTAWCWPTALDAVPPPTMPEVTGVRSLCPSCPYL